MKTLSKFWFASSPIDREHKQYLLLDYIQSVKQDFTLDVLYPSFSDLQSHYFDMSKFKQCRDEMISNMSRLKGLNFEEMKAEYEVPWINADFEEIADIVNYSMPHFQTYMQCGKRIYDSIANQMKWDIVGIMPTYKDEGYFILHVNSRIINTYRFKVEKLIVNEETNYGISLNLLESVQSKLKTYEDIKLSLIGKYDDLPVPFTMSIQTKEYPLNEAILPIIKRTGLMKIKNS